jgi:hypothetical protein
MLFRFFAILICIAVLITAFFSLLWGWIILVIPAISLTFILWTAKRRKWKEIPSLSPAANEMLKKFGHFYAMPFASTDFSASASAFQLCSMALGVIGLVKGFYWGVGLAIILSMFMAYVANLFNPTNYLIDAKEKSSHKEIIEYIRAQQKKRRKIVNNIS